MSTANYMNSARSRRRQAITRARTNIVFNPMRNLTNAVKDLALTTQNKCIPDHPDRRPMALPRRPQVMTFTRQVNKGQVTAQNGDTTGSIAFALSDLPSSSDFTSLFDQYRIAQVTLKFVPASAQFGPATTATDYPSILTVIDLDDDGVPASADTLRQYGTCMTTQNAIYFERVLTPRFAVAAYSGAFTSYSQSLPGQWVDCASPNVVHYGVKWATTPITVASGSYVLFNIEATYVIQCRSTI
jgi:hypothetical protein